MGISFENQARTLLPLRRSTMPPRAARGSPQAYRKWPPGAQGCTLHASTADQGRPKLPPSKSERCLLSVELLNNIVTFLTGYAIERLGQSSTVVETSAHKRQERFR
jgi:hypothetical protein